MPAGDFAYVGFVENINIKGVGPNSNQFLFALVWKTGHQSFVLDPFSEPHRYTAMASLITAAWAADKEVRVNTSPNPGGVAFASEIEVVREQAGKK
jgi:hypothetical protein